MAEEAPARANATARAARVVVHPDFRGGGPGIPALRAAVEWVGEGRIPEMERNALSRL